MRRTRSVRSSTPRRPRRRILGSCIGNPEAEGEVERDASTLSRVPINCEPAPTVVGDATFLAAGLCETVLITHGESDRSGVGRTRNVIAPASLAGQFEQPYGPMRRRLCRRRWRGRAHRRQHR